MPTRPGAQLPVFRMAPVPQCFQQVFIPPDTPGVLGRAGALTIQGMWNDVLLCPGPEVFDGNEMQPAVPKIILVAEAGSLLPSNVPEADPPVTLHVVFILRVRLPVAHLANEELVEVGMLPTHDDLQEVMQGSKRDLVRHQNVPPDRGVDAHQTDIQLVDLLG